MSRLRRGLLLAFDGVLADTENYHVAAWERLFDALGFDPPEEFRQLAPGHNDHDLMRAFFRLHHVENGNIDAWVDRKRVLMGQMLMDRPRLRRGVGELLARLAGLVRFGLYSQGPRRHVDAIIRAHRLTDIFETIVTADEIQTPLPDPETLFLAMKRLNLSTGRCVALESTSTGLIACHAAGLRCLIVGDNPTPPSWIDERCHDYLLGLEDLPEFFMRVGWADFA